MDSNDKKIDSLPEDWKTVRLGDLAQIVRGVSYRSENYCSEIDGFIFINLKCVGRNGGFRKDGIKYYKGTIKQNQFVSKGNILIANTDLTQNREVIGAPIEVPLLDKKACFSLDLTKLVTTSIIERRFLYYYLLSPSARNFMINNGNGTTVVHLAVSNVLNLLVPLPLLPEQRSIAKILSDLDSKIELNQKMNKTLEAIAQAIFKHWFIDFEFPNEEGKPYRSSGGEMVDSELGIIPKGWRVDNAVNLFKLEYGWHLPEWNRKNGNIPVFGSGGHVGFHDKLFVNGPGIIIGRAGKIGNNSIYYSDVAFCPLETTYYVSVSNNKLIRYIYIMLRKVPMLNTGSSVPNLSRESVHNTKIVIPKIELIEKFDDNIKQLFDLIENNKNQSQILSDIRDLLIPKLMSGKIRVPLEDKDAQ